jgi:hypothetical protein
MIADPVSLSGATAAYEQLSADLTGDLSAGDRR